jgi:hypothetical protein
MKSNNSGTAKVKIVKNERDPPLFTSKLLNSNTSFQIALDIGLEGRYQSRADDKGNMKKAMY